MNDTIHKWDRYFWRVVRRRWAFLHLGGVFYFNTPWFMVEITDPEGTQDYMTHTQWCGIRFNFSRCADWLPGSGYRYFNRQFTILFWAYDLFERNPPYGFQFLPNGEYPIRCFYKGACYDHR